MLRFGTKTLLFVFVLAALWFSTFGGYAAGRDVRASVLLIVLLAAGYAALYGHGKQRAFWLGFFAVMLLYAGNFGSGVAYKYVPNFSWRVQESPPQYQIVMTQPVVPAPIPPTTSPDDPNFVSPVPPQATAFFPAPAAPASARSQEFQLALNATIEAAWMLVLATVVGFVGIWIFGSLRGDRGVMP